MIKITTINNLFDESDRVVVEVGFHSPFLIDYIPLDRVSGDLHVVTSSIGRVEPDDINISRVGDGEEIIIYPSFGISLAVLAVIWLVIKIIAVVATIAAAAYAMYTANQAKKAAGSIKSETGTNDTLDNSPTYGWDGAVTQAKVDVPIAINYGKMVNAGNVINVFVTSIDDKNYLNILLSLGEGKLKSIGGLESDQDDVDIATFGDTVEIEGNPASNYTDGTLSVRLGTQDQTPIKGFNRVVNSFDLSSANIKLVYGDGSEPGYIYTTSYANVDTLVTHFRVPTGLYTTPGSSGKYHPWSISYEVYTRIHGSGDAWVLGASNTITEKTTSVLRRSAEITDLTPAKYDMLVKRTTWDASGSPGDSMTVGDLHLHSVEEIQSEELAYPYTALLGIKLMATDQLSGSIPNIVVDVEGLEIEVVDSDDDSMIEYSQNPSWCTRDLLTNHRYGVGDFLPSTAVDNDDFFDMAEYCDEEVDGGARFKLDMVIDSLTRSLDMLIQIATTFRCWPFYSASTVKFVIDKIETPTQLFTMGNIVANSFSETFHSIRDVYNVVEAQFLNEDNNYEREIIAVEDTDSIANNDPVRKRSLFLAGVTRREQAYRICRYILLISRNVTRDIKFKAGVDAVACQAGDVINFAHDVPQWGVASGRIASSTNASGEDATFTTTRDITLPDIASGEAYKIKVRHAGSDVIESQTLLSLPGSYPAGTPLTIDGNWTAAPQDYDVFAIGRDTGVADISTKPFRVVSIEREGEGEVSITCSEYIEAVYDESGDIPEIIQYSNLPDPRRPPSQVESISVVHSLTYAMVIYIGYDIADIDEDSGFFDHVDVYTTEYGTGSWEYEGSTKKPFYALHDFTPGMRYEVKVVAVSKWGVVANFDDAPTEDFHFTIGVTPPKVTGLQLKDLANSTTFVTADAHFVWNETAFTMRDLESDYSGGASRDIFFSHYLVEMWTEDIPGAWTKKRTETTQNPEYIYTLEKNTDDHDNSPKREFNIKVWAVDVFGSKSEYDATITVKNEAPSICTNFNVYISYHNKYITWDAHPDPDVVEYEVKRSFQFDLLDGPFTLYKGPNTFCNELGDRGYGYRLHAYDVFGDDESNEKFDFDDIDVGAEAWTYAQDTAPTDPIAGDIWFDTDDGNKMYRYNGTSWEAMN